MVTRKTPAARIALAAASLVLVLALVPAALAGKGKPGGGGSGGTTGSSSSLSLVLWTDNNGNGVANWGDTVTYNVSTTATSAPSVKTTCTQNGTVVLTGNASFYSGNPFSFMDYIALQSGAWTSGAADCTAVMYYSSGKKTVTLATLAYHVDA